MAGRVGAADASLTPVSDVVAVAELVGDFWTCLDRRRAGAAGEALSAVPTPASTTAATLAARFGPMRLAGVEEGIGELTCRAVGLLPAKRRAAVRAGTATIDLDGTDVEC